MCQCGVLLSQTLHACFLLPRPSSVCWRLLAFPEHAHARQSESGRLFASLFAMSCCCPCPFLSLFKCHCGLLLSHTLHACFLLLLRCLGYFCLSLNMLVFGKAKGGLLFVLFFAMSCCGSSSPMSLSECEVWPPTQPHPACLLPAPSSILGLLLAIPEHARVRPLMPASLKRESGL